MKYSRFLGLGVALAMGLASGVALAGGDAAKGAKVFKVRCKSCHTIAEGAKNLTGPNLFGVAGREAGLVPKFKYSKSYGVAGKGGLVWTDEQIFAYLKDPKKFMRKVTGNKKAKSRMTFKLKKESQRQDVIAYLNTMK